LLTELNLGSIPTLKVYNKIDLLESTGDQQRLIPEDGIGLSALDSKSLEPLLFRAQQMMKKVMGNRFQA